MIAFFRISVGGKDITTRFTPRLISLVMSHTSAEPARTAQIVLSDNDGLVRFPKTGTSVQVELGWKGGEMCRFEGEVDTVAWGEDRSHGSILSITARSMSFRAKGKEPHDRHWEDATLGRILEDAAGDAGMSIRVHADLAARKIAYEAQDRESFFTFANRLAARHGATFSIMGQRSAFVPRNKGLSVTGEALRTITVKRGDNLIAARGIIPLTDRYRFSASKASWYDIDKARLVQEKVQADSEVDVEDHVHLDQPGPDEAGWAAETDVLNAAREKGAGMLTINGEPAAEIEATVMVSGCRAGIDGAYTITGVTHAYDREGGFQTDLTLAHPHGSAGVDAR